MSDLIDRAKLLEVLEERKKPNNGGEDGTKERYRYMQWLTDYNAVIEAPTAEPKKGKWDYIGNNMFKCTCCWTAYTTQQLVGLRNYDADPYAPYFCPNCGADMRERV